MSKRSLYPLALFLLLLAKISVASSVTLDQADSYPIPDAQLWRPVPELITPPQPENILRALAQNTSINSMLGRKGAAVTRIPLRHQSDNPQTWYLVVKANYLDQGLAYWLPHEGEPVPLGSFAQLGDQTALSLMHYQALAFSLPADAEGDLVLYLAAQQFAIPLDLELMSPARFLRLQLIINSLSLLAIGMMLTLSLIALMLFARTRYAVTLACAGYIGLHGLGWLLASGLLNDVFTPAKINLAHGGMLLFPFAIASACQFSRLLFNCSSQFPRLNHYLNRLSLTSLVLGIIGLVLPFQLLFWADHLLASVWIATALGLGLYMLNKADFRARYFLIGNLIYACALGYFIFSHSYPHPQAYSSELIVLLALAADCLCILFSLAEWLGNQRKEFNRTYTSARIDPLTGIGNRYAFNEQLKQAKAQLGLIFIDLDGMKQVNDGMGHQAGDELLKQCAQVLQQALGSLGEVFRTGGDEFIGLLEYPNTLSSSELEHQVTAQIHQAEAQLRQAGWPDTGISYGFASSAESNNLSQCLALADKRMYEHKRSKKIRR